jgi:hypothetical protein
VLLTFYNFYNYLFLRIIFLKKYRCINTIYFNCIITLIILNSLGTILYSFFRKFVMFLAVPLKQKTKTDSIEMLVSIEPSATPVTLDGILLILAFYILYLTTPIFQTCWQSFTLDQLIIYLANWLNKNWHMFPPL